ncbi:Predicted N-acetyltransferase YhbS [Variovorax sp. YR750]|uniref:GNAT family N-acetyltransferase n=1 Tax=Variovorax sp. YR750 TaxID=1884384 RepID=UPI0008C3C6F8|nr:GNAT family N-acetyltransferase [Variovorax sp. YR750]SEM42111.1 Predicted N-acetyltransferase YhbS [Variovorax sp. YR750]
MTAIEHMTTQVRPALPEDAMGISQVIVRSLRESNAKDYSAEIIARIETNFSPEAVEKLIAHRWVFVAIHDRRIVGTASLDGHAVRTVFVAPEVQSRGIGRQLMAVVEQAAQEKRVAVLSVPSSITAEPFYARLGFKPVRDCFHGDERTIIMERNLAA